MTIKFVCFKSFAAIAAFLLASGCASVIDVKRYSGPGQKGARYSLPEPYLLVKPKPDGTATYDWVFLPNKENEYAVEASSFLSAYTLELALENGFLKSAAFNVTATTTASKLAELVGEVTAVKKDTEVAAEKAADKAASDKVAADEKTANDRVAAADKAIADANAAVVTAQAEVEFYASPEGSAAKAETVLAAKLTLAKAQATLTEMQRRRAALPFTSAGARDSGTAGGPAKLKQAWGPMLFRLVQTAKGVELKAVSFQEKVDTAGSIKVTGGSAGDDKIKLTLSKVTKDATSTIVTFTSSAGIELGTGPMQVNRKGDNNSVDTKVVLTKGGDDKSHVMTFSALLPPGDYTAMVPFKQPKVTEETANTLQFKVQ